MEYKILIVEDQKEIFDIVSKYLEKEGYGCAIAKDGFEAMELFSQDQFHLILLDVMMPGIDGFEVLKEIRETSNVPIVMLTARQEEVDRLKGFDYGADDYVVKPFSPRELVRRVNVLVRRIYNKKEEMMLPYRDLKLNISQQRLFKGNTEIPLTSIEFNILKVFFENSGQIMTRDQIIKKAFGYEYDGYDRNIDTYIK
ncbi:MAG: response regulator transcription factor, partial [Clostridia bacterium]|nr:response regulator transcription factor [Clostridia bacterium]